MSSRLLVLQEKQVYISSATVLAKESPSSLFSFAQMKISRLYLLFAFVGIWVGKVCNCLFILERTESSAYLLKSTSPRRSLLGGRLLNAFSCSPNPFLGERAKTKKPQEIFRIIDIFIYYFFFTCFWHKRLDFAQGR